MFFGRGKFGPIETMSISRLCSEVRWEFNDPPPGVANPVDQSDEIVDLRVSFGNRGRRGLARRRNTPPWSACGERLKVRPNGFFTPPPVARRVEPPKAGHRHPRLKATMYRRRLPDRRVSRGHANRGAALSSVALDGVMEDLSEPCLDFLSECRESDHPFRYRLQSELPFIEYCKSLIRKGFLKLERVATGYMESGRLSWVAMNGTTLLSTVNF